MSAEPLEERAQRILDSAIALAEEGGFEAVRIRDIAAHAQVALGTLYKRFKSKDEILVAALDHELTVLQKAVGWLKADGRTYKARVLQFFELVTQNMCAREKLTRAVIKSVTSGEPSLAEKVGRFHEKITELIASVMGGDGSKPADERRLFTADEIDEASYILSQIWFAALVGWSGGLFQPETVIDQVEVAAKWVIKGMQAP